MVFHFDPHPCDWWFFFVLNTGMMIPTSISSAGLKSPVMRVVQWEACLSRTSRRPPAAFYFLMLGVQHGKPAGQFGVANRPFSSRIYMDLHGFTFFKYILMGFNGWFSTGILAYPKNDQTEDPNWWGLEVANSFPRRHGPWIFPWGRGIRIIRNCPKWNHTLNNCHLNLLKQEKWW
jgi:hypothetical protein